MSSWHVGTDALDRYSLGDATMVERSSIEAHLVACEQCRVALREARGSSPAGETWLAIADRIDVPRRSLRQVPTALSVSLSGPVLVASMLSVVVSLIAAVAFVAEMRSRSSFVVLIGLAPVAPVALVVAAFRPELDPSGGLATATPMAGGRLPFLRALIGSMLALAAGAVATTFTPVSADLLLAWLLPGAALAAIVLASATFVDPLRVGVVASVAWWGLIGTWLNRSRRLPVDVALADLATNQSWAQLAWVAVTVAAGAVLLKRRDEIPAWRTA